MKIIKRDGTQQTFDINKIKNAIRCAFLSVSTEISEEKLNQISQAISDVVGQENREIGVETIQDKVEETLMAHQYYQEAKSYILYRQKRSENRTLIHNFVHVLKTKKSSHIFKRFKLVFQKMSTICVY